MCVAFSPDGFRFTEHPGNPVIPAHAPGVRFDDPGYEHFIGDIIDECWDPLRQEYLFGCKINQSGYPEKPHHHVAGVTAGKGFVTWPRPRLIVIPTAGEEIEEFYGFKPIVRGDLYIGFLRVLRDDLAATTGGPVEGIGWTELMTRRNEQD